ncbi:MAG: hypothetical protein AAB295_03865, partial [Chloroflexota bacterium]
VVLDWARARTRVELPVSTMAGGGISEGVCVRVSICDSTFAGTCTTLGAGGPDDPAGAGSGEGALGASADADGGGAGSLAITSRHAPPVFGAGDGGGAGAASGLTSTGIVGTAEDIVGGASWTVRAISN